MRLFSLVSSLDAFPHRAISSSRYVCACVCVWSPCERLHPSRHYYPSHTNQAPAAFSLPSILSENDYTISCGFFSTTPPPPSVKLFSLTPPQLFFFFPLLVIRYARSHASRFSIHLPFLHLFFFWKTSTRGARKTEYTRAPAVSVLPGERDVN